MFKKKNSGGIPCILMCKDGKFNEKNTVHRVFLISASCVSVQRQGLKLCL